MDLILIYKFIKLLSTPFKDWPAYKLGIIDENGEILRSRKDLSTLKERQAFGLFENMVRKIKQLLGKIPGGKSNIASYAAALWFLREHEFIEVYGDTLTEEELEECFNDYYVPLCEELGVGSGVIAGVGDGEEPIVNKKAAKKYKKKNEAEQKKWQ